MARTIARPSPPGLQRPNVLGGLLLSLHLITAPTAIGAVITWASPVHAEGASQSKEVLFVLDGVPEDVDPERARAAIARELAAPVTRADHASSSAGTLTLSVLAGKHIRLAYRAADGRLTEREIDLPAEPERAEEVIALLAGNLVRDEAAELGAALKKRVEKPPVRAPIAAPPVGPVNPPALPAPVAVAPPACGREGHPRHLAGLDFLPFLGTSTFVGVGVSRRLSLNILGGYTAGLDGLELGGLVNIDAEFTCGVQMAGLANLTFGPVQGAQLAGILDVGGRLDGVQAGLVNLVTGDVVGAQVGLVNLAGGRVRGAQIGLVNVSSTSTFSLGLINIFRDGRLELDAWGQESGLLMAGIKHGSGRFHNIYGVGVLPFGARARFSAAMGLGVHFPLTDRLFLDLDALDYALFDASSIAATLNIAQARVVLGARLMRKLAVYGGPSYNVATSWNGDVPALSPYGATFTNRGGGTATQGWPGITLGLQAL